MDANDYRTYLELLKRKEFEKAVEFKNSKVPDVLYKYFTLDGELDTNESKLTYLENRVLFLSDFDAFNDPFEGRFFIFDKKELEKRGWDKKQVEAYYKGLTKAWKVTCLSDTDEQNMPMWAYYANNHKGFCVKYEFNQTQKKYIFPVNYEKQRQNANSIITSMIHITSEKEKPDTLSGDAHVLNQMIFLSMTVKHMSWIHEKEYRILSPEDYFPAAPKEIYIGMKCEEGYKRRLAEIARGSDGTCKVYEMEIDRDSEQFELKKKKLMSSMSS